ncbi:MAG: hypothetical protein FH756_03505 [Firmicutes bacterium]|nr:hypothetical protein [Bacillota bacterium]
MERVKITLAQASAILINVIISTAIIILPGAAARHDAWIVTIIGTAIGIAAAFVITSLGNSFPRQTIIEYSETLLGKYAGKAVAALFLIFFIYLAGLTVRDLGDFATTTDYHQTPLVVFHIIIISIAIYATRCGLEVIARVTELFLIIILTAIIIILAVITLIPGFDLANLLPIMDSGFKPVITGSMGAGDFLTQSLVLAMIIPFLTNKKAAGPAAFTGVIISGLLLTLTAAFALAVYGTMAVDLTYPFFNAVKMVSLAKTIERLDLVLKPIWSMAVIIKVSFLLYIISLGTAQLLKLSDHKPLVLPLALIVVDMAHLVYTTKVNYLAAKQAIASYTLTMQLLLPFLLLTIAFIRKKLQP